MARRKKSDEQSVSLFPFLSILACVIGTLTLMITALALGQMDDPAVADAEQLEQAGRQLAKAQDDIRQLEGMVGSAVGAADENRSQLAQAQKELAEAKLESAQLIRENDQPPEPVERPTPDPADHHRRVAELEAELKGLQEKLQQLTAELATRETTPEEAEVVIRPGGSGVDLIPTFVECTAASIVIYDSPEPKTVPRGSVGSDKTFLDLLDRIAGRPKATVVFLVRSDGLSTYNLARNVAQSRYARNGKLPVVGKGRIDLSLFEDLR